MAKKRTKYYAKIMQYQMTEEVVTALQAIMAIDGHSTMSGAISYCIINHLKLRQSLREEESASNKLYHDKINLEESISNLIHSLRSMDKHTKTI